MRHCECYYPSPRPLRALNQINTHQGASEARHAPAMRRRNCNGRTCLNMALDVMSCLGGTKPYQPCSLCTLAVAPGDRWTYAMGEEETAM